MVASHNPMPDTGSFLGDRAWRSSVMRMRDFTSFQAKKAELNIQNGAHYVSSAAAFGSSSWSKKAEKAGNHYRGTVHAIT